ILAALLLPTLLRAKVSAKVTMAKAEMKSIITAISQYKGDYSRMPASSGATAVGRQNLGNDFTYGTHISSIPADIVTGYQVLNQPTGGGKAYENCNSEVLNIITANGNKTPIPDCNPDNLNNKLNPRNLKLFSAKVANNSNLVSD